MRRDQEIEGDGPRPHFRRVIAKPAPAPADRPKCPTCTQPLRPSYEIADRQGNARDGWITTEEWRGRYRGYGAFCTLRCASTFANAAHRAGYRLKRPPR